MSNRKNYPGYIERHGKTYRITLSVDGKRHRFRAPTHQEAERIARGEYDRLRRLSRNGAAERLRLSQVLSGFKEDQLPLKKTEGTRSAYLASLLAFEKYFIDVLDDPWVDGIRPKEVNRFLCWRKTHRLKGNGDVSNRTLQRDRTVLHTVFEYARMEEYVNGNPVTKATALEAEGREPVILSDDQLDALLLCCVDPILHLYVLVLAETGLRCDSEALWLRWENIDLSDGFIFVDTARRGGRRNRTKSGKTRHVPITDRLREALGDHMASFRLRVYGGQRSPWVFHHVQNRRRAVAGQRIGCLRNGFDRAVVRAGLPSELNQHDLRHRRVTTWLEEGKPIHLVKEAMGHSDIKTTLGYYRFLKSHLRVLVEPQPSQEGLRRLVSG